MSNDNNTIVISVGGSLICPEKIDVNFLKEFRSLVLSQIKKDKRFIIITGGGRTARNYQEAAQAVGELTSEDLDWLGIHGTRINAHLMRAIFHEHAHPEIVKDPTKKVNFKEDILVAGGWKPGFSTDYDAIMLAKQFKVKKIINLTNIDYVYDKDPRKFNDAKPLKEMSWNEFRKLIGNKWSPGLNAPFDPVASKEAEANKMIVHIINGANLENINSLLEGKDFVGTTIS
jgi:uridylate kinase